MAYNMSSMMARKLHVSQKNRIHYIQSSTPVSFDITSTVERYRAKPARWHQKLEQFSKALDSRITLGPHESNYADIVRGVEAIVTRLCEQLALADDRFTQVVWKRNGSLYAGFKVGLPYEADFLLELPEPPGVYVGTYKTDFQRLVFSIWETGVLVDDPAVWKIHGVEFHKAGACFIMEYNKRGQSGNPIGLTIDLVPCYKLCKEKATKRFQFTDKARQYLRNTGLAHLHENNIYRLFDKIDYDTGLIEYQILQNLDEDTKRGYRLAKFFLQQYTGDLNVKPTGALDSNDCVRLYGYKPRTRSYWLRLCFLHLVLGTHGTEEADSLKGGVLMLCLLEMLFYACTLPNIKSFMDPIQNKSILFDMTTDDFNERLSRGEVFKRIIEPLLEEPWSMDATAFPLMNNARDFRRGRSGATVIGDKPVTSYDAWNVYIQPRHDDDEDDAWMGF